MFPANAFREMRLADNVLDVEIFECRKGNENGYMNNNNVMSADKTIKFVPAKTVLKYTAGDEINLNKKILGGYRKLFFAEIESEYSS